ncbi:hypothetical protein [Chitinasiproducens palmae]|uniref:hypothetical protein n=1 Tax=Chitinasiproducens palmae TaxID=1770053 RepID=UPI00111420E1|nr:hypothetical protein [Chitinasiproducens palmae]
MKKRIISRIPSNNANNSQSDAKFITNRSMPSRGCLTLFRLARWPVWYRTQAPMATTYGCAPVMRTSACTGAEGATLLIMRCRTEMLCRRS